MSAYLRHLPNVISVARIVLVGPIVWSLLTERFSLAIGLFLVAGASDGLDGFLAKRFGWSSRLGGILDALADKFLLISTFVCLGWLGLFPWWLVLSVLARDLLIVSGAIVYNFRIEAVQPEPSLISKLNTLLQIALAAVGVVEVGFGGIPGWLLWTLIWAVMLTVLLSGTGYVREWSRRARAGGTGLHD
ncbi:MAG: CDP-alcohol phosphatidyltransferase family protein [Chromatiaceae bacterium]|nr:CDP-alcohol phosphatidyltransferase family protein [Gammaproteobacteria bacterium]MCP5303964.1 CDP-alcohol phosphatidyltransferase family protein [Chromatiaceae bacterium]MCP5313691.1 CDP-alcohol phosphatidyltransferase family protein [Chromatiaceae bacterium]